MSKKISFSSRLNGLLKKKDRIWANGEISLWGCFHFGRGYRNKYVVKWLGVALVGFHPDFVRYARQGCRLENQNGSLSVIKGNRVVRSYRPRELFVVEESETKVSKSGHVRIYPNLNEKGLSKAAKGEDPGEYDNSPYIRVNPTLAGTNVIVLEEGDKYMVFLRDGTRVPCKVYRPFALKRWGIPEPRFDRCALED